MVYNNSANINPTGLVKADGSGQFSGVTTTQYNVQIGSTANGLTSVAPSATSGVPLISQGSSANPAFGTAVVAGGGTGNSSFTAYSVICAGTTSTGAFQNVSGLGTATQVLTSNGPGALPTWQNASGGGIPTIGSSSDNALVRWDGNTGSAIQNGVITEDDTGNLSQSTAVSGASLSVLTSNTSNTANATAYHQCQVAGATAADAYYVANISGGQAWSWGLDNSDSDAYVLSASATPGTTNVMRVSTSGEINYPIQPSFSAYLSADVTNATGDNTAYTVALNTEEYDQDNNFAANTFTAPIAGRYRFNWIASVNNLLVGHTKMTVSVGGRSVFRGNPYAIADSDGFCLVNGSVDLSLAAAATVTLVITVAGSTKTVTVKGTTSGTFLSGQLQV